jgi:hypothetical protein
MSDSETIEHLLKDCPHPTAFKAQQRLAASWNHAGFETPVETVDFLRRKADKGNQADQEEALYRFFKTFTL